MINPKEFPLLVRFAENISTEASELGKKDKENTPYFKSDGQIFHAFARAYIEANRDWIDNDLREDLNAKTPAELRQDIKDGFRTLEEEEKFILDSALQVLKHPNEWGIEGNGFADLNVSDLYWCKQFFLPPSANGNLFEHEHEAFIQELIKLIECACWLEDK